MLHRTQRRVYNIIDLCIYRLLLNNASFVDVSLTISSLKRWFADKTFSWQDDKIARVPTSAFIWRVVSKMSCQRIILLPNLLSAKWLVSKTSCQRIILSVKWPVGEIYCQWTGCQQNWVDTKTSSIYHNAMKNMVISPVKLWWRQLIKIKWLRINVDLCEQSQTKVSSCMSQCCIHSYTGIMHKTSCKNPGFSLRLSRQKPCFSLMKTKKA